MGALEEEGGETGEQPSEVEWRCQTWLGGRWEKQRGYLEQDLLGWEALRGQEGSSRVVMGNRKHTEGSCGEHQPDT